MANQHHHSSLVSMSMLMLMISLLLHLFTPFELCEAFSIPATKTSSSTTTRLLSRSSFYGTKIHEIPRTGSLSTTTILPSSSNIHRSIMFPLKGMMDGKSDLDLDLVGTSASIIRSSDSKSESDSTITSSRSKSSTRSLIFDDPKNLINIANLQIQDINAQTATSRRLFFSSVLLSSSIAIAPKSPFVPPAYADEIKWTSSPVNKRSGITVFKAEETYNVRFITYLSRFLLSFDEECQRWWYKRASDIPRTASAETVDAMRLKQFAAFSASVEVGLQEYVGGGNGKDDADGPRRLMNSLLSRYGRDIEDIKQERKEMGLSPLKASEEEKEKREIKEAKRQIALLFALLQTYQPVEDITKLLAAIDNGMVQRVVIENPGRGYAPGYGAPYVTFPPPDAGDDFDVATGRAILRPNGKILRVDIKKRGFGYTKAPTVTITPPLAEAFGSPTARAATAKVSIYKDGINKGRIERIELTDEGSGYNLDETIILKISPPELPKSEGGEIATATIIPEYEVGEIVITNPGSGYVIEKPIEVMVEPPPLTARVNLNDPMIVQAFFPESKGGKGPMEDITAAPGSRNFNTKAWKMAKIGGGGGCVGRACYDDPVVAVAYPAAEADSYKSFRKESDWTVQKVNSAVNKRGKDSVTISGIGDEDGAKQVPFWTGGKSTSSTLLSLLPAGIGLIYSKDLKRYQIIAGDSVTDYDWADDIVSPGIPIDPDFGPRGRSPIEREKNLTLDTLWRFFVAGALCQSTVHLVLTPIDVVKTNMQTNPAKFSNPLSTFGVVLEEEGVTGFFAGWIPTFVGFFINGGIAYTAVEFFRRLFRDVFADLAATNDIVIIVGASLASAILGTLTLAPSETLRIRSVAQPDYAPNVLGVAQRMVEEEGVITLFSAVPAFMFKEIPFVVTKFTVFTLFTQYLYEAFPAAREDIQLSLLISLAGGTLGGICAAIVSNPADATISAMKKAKSDDGPLATFKKLAGGESGGLFRGLGVRMFFYTLIVSLQFLVYDAIRFSLGIGADDLKLYLDVLGGALSEKGGPI